MVDMVKIAIITKLNPTYHLNILTSVKCIIDWFPQQLLQQFNICIYCLIVYNDIKTMAIVVVMTVIFVLFVLAIIVAK